MPDELLWVQIIEAKPNKLFTEEQRAAVRFLRYNRAVPCAECGKRKRTHWTMICEFLAHSMGQFALAKSGLVHPPLTGVCGDHLLAPAWPSAPEKEFEDWARNHPETPPLPDEAVERKNLIRESNND